jgi:hypothetical protein
MKQPSHGFWRKGTLALLFLLLACLLLAAGAGGGEQGAKSEEQQLGDLISHYFSSWSKADMAAYGNFFHPQASIYFIDKAGRPYFRPLEEFLAAQGKAQLSGKEPMTEKPTQTTLEVRGRIARVAVRWELHKGSATITGTDYFTFLKTDAGWKILNLVFEQDKK